MLPTVVTSTSLSRATLVVACLATAMLMLDVAIVNTAAAQIGHDLHVGPGSLRWVVDAYTLPLAATVLTLGALADRLGRRLLFTAGLVTFTAASAACAAAPDIVALDLARAVQGLGAAALFASSLTLVADAYPDPDSRAGAMGAYGATVGAAFAIGPLLGGSLAAGPGWRWIFLVNVPLGIAAVVATGRSVRESRDPDARPVDLRGQLTLTAGLLLLVVALLRARDAGWSNTGVLVELAGAATFLAAFVGIQARSANPMLPLSLLRIRPFAAAQIAALALSASFFALYIYATLYLQDVLGLTAIEAALVYVPGTVLIVLVSRPAARMGARASPRVLVSGGLALVAAGLAAQLLAGADSSWAAVLPGRLLASVGTGLLNPTLAALTIGSVPAGFTGRGGGVGA
jgi:EmrB/QacA subfamily drug resistance transporter